MEKAKANRLLNKVLKVVELNLQTQEQIIKQENNHSTYTFKMLDGFVVCEHTVQAPASKKPFTYTLNLKDPNAGNMYLMPISNLFIEELKLVLAQPKNIKKI